MVKRIDFMFNEDVRQMIVQGNLNDYRHFIRNFAVPRPEKGELWLINNFPLIILNLTVNINVKKHKGQTQEQ